MSVGLIRKVGERDLARNVNKLQNVEACFHFLASKCPLTGGGMHYRSNRVTQIIIIHDDGTQ